jgi:hypothetical protein
MKNAGLRAGDVVTLSVSPSVPTTDRYHNLRPFASVRRELGSDIAADIEAMTSGLKSLLAVSLLLELEVAGQFVDALGADGDLQALADHCAEQACKGGLVLAREDSDAEEGDEEAEEENHTPNPPVTARPRKKAIKKKVAKRRA